MKKKKEFDCVTFKYEMYAKAWELSGAKTMREYVDFVNAAAKDPSLYEKHMENLKRKSKARQRSLKSQNKPAPSTLSPNRVTLP